MPPFTPRLGQPYSPTDHSQAPHEQKAQATSPEIASTRSVPRQDLEWLRLFNCFCIVYFHCALTLPAWMRGCLLVFIITTAYLSGTRHQIFSWRIQRLRTRRLLGPWAVWMLIYGVINLRHQHPFVWHSEGLLGAINACLSGSAHHLWYVPFAFMALMLLDAAHARWRETTVAWGGMTLAVAWMAAASWWRPLADHWPRPWPSYATLIAGLGLGIFYRHFHRLERIPAMAALLAFAMVCWLNRDVPSAGTSGLMALLFTLCLLKQPGQWPRLPDVSAWSQCTFGVYMLHALVLTQLMKLGAMPPLTQALLTFGISLLMVRWLRSQWPRLASWLG